MKPRSNPLKVVPQTSATDAPVDRESSQASLSSFAKSGQEKPGLETYWRKQMKHILGAIAISAITYGIYIDEKALIIGGALVGLYATLIAVDGLEKK
jgi:hypothetical protein